MQKNKTGQVGDRTRRDGREWVGGVDEVVREGLSEVVIFNRNRPPRVSPAKIRRCLRWEVQSQRPRG